MHASKKIQSRCGGQVYEIGEFSVWFWMHVWALKQPGRNSVVWHSAKVTRGQVALCLRAGAGLNVFNVSFYLCKSAPILWDLTVSLNSLGDEVSILVKLKQTWRQTIDEGLLLHVAEAAEWTLNRPGVVWPCSCRTIACSAEKRPVTSRSALALSALIPEPSAAHRVSTGKSHRPCSLLSKSAKPQFGAVSQWLALGNYSTFWKIVLWLRVRRQDQYHSHIFVRKGDILYSFSHSFYFYFARIGLHAFTASLIGQLTQPWPIWN